MGAQWLKAIHGRVSQKTVSFYALVLDTHLSKAFPSLLDATYESIRSYIDRRLTEVQPQTVRHELSVLRQCLEWAAEQRLISQPPAVPPIPKRATGTPFEKTRRVKADEYSPEEIRELLGSLPDTSTDGIFWVRPRLELQYETGLRSGTLDALSVPEHWRPGERELRLGKMVLKSRKAYTMPLSDRAVKILERVAPREGVIFGHHDLSEYVGAAAERALPPGKAERFAPTHLRSAFVSHLLEQGAALTEAQYLVGHSRPSTTDRYTRARQRQAESALVKLGRRA